MHVICTNVGIKLLKYLKLKTQDDLKHINRHIAFVLISLTVLLDSCSDNLKLDRNEVEYIEIRKQLDTVSLRLTSAQVDDLIDRLNKSNVKGLTKYLPEYTLMLHLKGDSVISYRASRDLIKESDDLTYTIGETDYFRTLWLTQVGLSKNWFKYSPIYKKDDELTEQNTPIDKKQIEAIKKVLTHYNHDWTEIRGQVFYEGKIDKELIWNYTTKANDTVWISEHK